MVNYRIEIKSHLYPATTAFMEFPEKFIDILYSIEKDATTFLFQYTEEEMISAGLIYKYQYNDYSLTSLGHAVLNLEDAKYE